MASSLGGGAADSVGLPQASLYSGGERSVFPRASVSSAGGPSRSLAGLRSSLTPRAIARPPSGTIAAHESEVEDSDDDEDDDDDDDDEDEEGGDDAEGGGDAELDDGAGGSAGDGGSEDGAVDGDRSQRIMLYPSSVGGADAVAARRNIAESVAATAASVGGAASRATGYTFGASTVGGGDQLRRGNFVPKAVSRPLEGAAAAAAAAAAGAEDDGSQAYPDASPDKARRVQWAVEGGGVASGAAADESRRGEMDTVPEGFDLALETTSLVAAATGRGQSMIGGALVRRTLRDFLWTDEHAAEEAAAAYAAGEGGGGGGDGEDDGNDAGTGAYVAPRGRRGRGRPPKSRASHAATAAAAASPAAVAIPTAAAAADYDGDDQGEGVVKLKLVNGVIMSMRESVAVPAGGTAAASAVMTDLGDVAGDAEASDLREASGEPAAVARLVRYNAVAPMPAVAAMARIGSRNLEINGTVMAGFD